MELPDGYKLTDIGVIPNTWDTKSYGALFNFLRTATFSRSDLTQSEAVSYVHYGDIHTKLNDYLDLDKVELPTVSSEMAKRYTLLADGDVIIVDASEDYEGVGKSVEVKNVGTKKAVSGLHTFLLRGKTDELSNGFKAYLHSNPLVKSQFQKLATGMKVFGVNKSNLKTVEIPLPPVPEQEAIAEVLSDVDALILALDDLIEKKRNIQQGAMQELLTGKSRLAGFRESWVRKPLGLVAPLQRGFDLPTRNIRAGIYPVVYSNGVLNHHTEYRVKGPGVVTGRSGTIGRVNYVTDNFFPHNTSLWVTDFAGNCPKYIYYLYQSVGLERFGSGSGVPTLNRNDVHSFDVELPADPAEQAAIADVLTTMDVELGALKRERTKYAAIKQGMMQELLTGKTRLT